MISIHRPRFQPRILLAEDDDLVRLTLGRLLRKAGCAVVGEAETAEQTVALAASCEPDLCLIDIMLADGSNGIDAAEIILERFGLPVVLMSGAADPPFVISFLRKPFSEQQMLDVLTRTLGRKFRQAA